MFIKVSYIGEEYEVNFNMPIAIAIPFNPNPFKQVNCFDAPPFETYPVRTNSFVGSLNEGGIVNFFNIKINPHGNGTHTETNAHIYKEENHITSAFNRFHFISRLITIFPTLREDGDRVITLRSIKLILEDSDIPEALIFRTMPNDDSKLTRNYSNTNPPYFEGEALAWLVEKGVLHILCDLPSVDRENDDAKFLAHKAFWKDGSEDRKSSTITELIFVDNAISDGIYFLTFQILPLHLDASPSNPILYKMNKTA